MEPAANELELLQELERFTTRFSDRVSQAMEILQKSPRREVRDEALNKLLLYVSSAVEIASGQIVHVNLLDMIVFVRLSRTALERFWIPRLYGIDGAELAGVFARSQAELDEVAGRVLTPGQREELDGIIETWLAENPGQVRVEGVRMADFSAAAGSAAAGRVIKAKGILSSVKTASQVANQAQLLTERGLFLVHRLPFLWRMQARVGAREVLADTWRTARRALIGLGVAAAGALALRSIASLIRSKIQHGDGDRRLIGHHR